ncbi:hypothetical protein AB1Y20_016133 [Prymnesium parvum]|uniref:Fe2OG dioxygenase domain-containing protein n=1 Tax=Prymnesium parvum TaxID=97485 RepID=A0AB34K2R3_PRYPA
MSRVALPLALIPSFAAAAAVLHDHTLSWAAANLSSQLATFHTDAFPPQLFLALRQAVASVTASRVRRSNFKHNKGATWWWPVTDGPAGRPAPRSAIEVGLLHLHRLGGFAGARDAPVVGAEWWIQEREAHEGIGYHYDKDEAYASERMTMRFPEVATVTYLSGSGGPTFIVNQTTPDGNAEVPELPSDGCVSYPEPNKHLLFRGNLQHGVAEQLTTGERQLVKPGVCGEGVE